MTFLVPPLAMLTLTILFFASLALIRLIDMLYLTAFLAVLRERDDPYMASLACSSLLPKQLWALSTASPAVLPSDGRV
eukprot:12881248-Prorocentrum_lima.AAC.1